MEKFIEKLSSYNLLNYLLPGVVMCIFMDEYWEINIIRDNIVESVFIYYFVGMVISRIGSILIEPILERCKCIERTSYEKYTEACKADKQIETLSESNNTYRTMTALFCLLLLGKMALFMCEEVFPMIIFKMEVLIAGLLLLFACAYRKQTKYIKKRVENLVE